MNPSASGDPPASPALVARVSSAFGFSEAAHRRAMELAGVPPGRESWSHAIDRFLLLFGFMCVLVGVAAFFAYNWGGLHKFAKFALVEAGIVACVALCLWRGIDHAVVV